MTYGWAVLVVLAAIGALAYFGVGAFDRSDVPEGYNEDDPTTWSVTELCESEYVEESNFEINHTIDFSCEEIREMLITETLPDRIELRTYGTNVTALGNKCPGSWSRTRYYSDSEVRDYYRETCVLKR